MYNNRYPFLAEELKFNDKQFIPSIHSSISGTGNVLDLALIAVNSWFAFSLRLF